MKRTKADWLAILADRGFKIGLPATYRERGSYVEIRRSTLTLAQLEAPENGFHLSHDPHQSSLSGESRNPGSV
ncbi:hypothetical protein RB620_25545 [Paenibacillus sp. LHD-117]|uniref:hypothetical protein n=1 Tax=Paenibacillus sp. LHD-117 TaxID=3071412 RepID=UPI0027E0E55F|nr:hypothetical protein [Paenibacillus sp. LHD-117]MDQ6422796.1 hypothetical protein [Paenibacillus sp. LHD-117]